MTYQVYFEIYGKKMQVEIEADSAVQAKEIIRNKIVFCKIIPNKVTPPDSDMPDFLMDLFR